MKSLHRITLALVAAAGALALSTAAFARPALSADCAQSSGAGQDGAATQAADCARTGVPVVTGGGNDLRISQVYGGGGGSSGYYLYDYVELFNAGTSSADLTGHSLQYGSYNGNFGSSSSNIFAFPAGTTLAAGKYLLVQLGTAGTGGIALPVTPDAVTTNLNMGATRGKVALASIATALGCGATATPCALPHADIIDLAAYGGSNNGEGGTSINNGVNLTNQQGGVRKSDGCQDTDDNNADFDVLDGAALVPRNGASPAHSCGGPVTHTVTSSVGTPSGTITPLGAQTVNEGDTIAFTLAADPGYAIDNVASTCGGTLDGG
ncbi:MAG: lamin tail domain-containing protein, partial [Xanthomonadales bacterium]|nr:lamin tail domain-containing protein [Xanthomonadales bacterium]